MFRRQIIPVDIECLVPYHLATEACLNDMAKEIEQRSIVPPVTN